MISKLSNKYSSPKFRPHVTLAGGFGGEKKELAAKAKILSRSLKPFEARLTRVRCLDEFFRSLFVLVEKTPEIMTAHRVARNLFGMPRHDYLPHLSLIYGKFSASQKREMMKETGKRFDASFTARKICLVLNKEQGRKSKWTAIRGFRL